MCGLGGEGNPINYKSVSSIQLSIKITGRFSLLIIQVH